MSYPKTNFVAAVTGIALGGLFFGIAFLFREAYAAMGSGIRTGRFGGTFLNVVALIAGMAIEALADKFCGWAGWVMLLPLAILALATSVTGLVLIQIFAQPYAALLTGPLIGAVVWTTGTALFFGWLRD